MSVNLRALRNRNPAAYMRLASMAKAQAGVPLLERNEPSEDSERGRQAEYAQTQHLHEAWDRAAEARRQTDKEAEDRNDWTMAFLAMVTLFKSEGLSPAF